MALVTADSGPHHDAPFYFVQVPNLSEECLKPLYARTQAIARFSCTLREQIRERERQQVVLLLDDVPDVKTGNFTYAKNVRF